MLTLWDLVKQVVAPKTAPKRPMRGEKKARPTSAPGRKRSGGAQARYDEMVAEYVAKYRVRVRKWRTSMSGVAWQVTYRDGTAVNLIESPRVKGPMSAAIFLHEIGHHAIGLSVYRPRCLEEYHAWAFAIREMEARGLNITEGVRRRMHRSLHYAVGKAMRRGIKAIPAELEPYLHPWSG
jgi:hypothetical protein